MPTVSAALKTLIPIYFFFLLTLFEINHCHPDQYWNRFRGPNGQGTISDADPPIQFDEAANLRWKTELPSGHSSPVLWNDMIVLTGYNGGKLETICIDRDTGDIRWSKTAPTGSIEKFNDFSSPAASTPAIDQDRVFVYFGSFGLICYDHQGQEIWEHPVPTPENMHGTSTSPILFQNLVYLIRDSMNGDSYLLALDRQTGKIVWKEPRPTMNPNWSTPILWTHDGITELMVLGGGRLTAYNPTTGKPNWWVTGFSNAITIPVVGNRYLYASTSSLYDAESKVNVASWEFYASFDTNQDEKIQVDEIPEGFQIVLRDNLPENSPGYSMPGRLMIRFNDLDQDNAMSRTELEEVVKSMNFNVRSSIQAIAPGGSADVTSEKVVWKFERAIPEMPSPLFYKDKVYMVTNGGVVTCLDAITGSPLFRERMGATGIYCASPIAANDRLYVCSNSGAVTVVSISGKPTVLAQHKFSESIFATPALHQNMIYLRTQNHLYAFQNKKGSSGL